MTWMDVCGRAAAALLAALLAMALPQRAWAQASFGTCDGRVFVTTSEYVPESTTLYEVNKTTNPFTFTTLGVAPIVYNAIGFNPADAYLYGMRLDSSTLEGNELYRIASDGSAVNLGVVTLSTGGTMPPHTWLGGAFSLSGEFYIYSDDPGVGNHLYRVDIATRVATLITLSSTPVRLIDFGFVGSMIYGSVKDHQIVRIDPATGNVTYIGTNATGEGDVAMWSGINNTLFGASDGALRQYDLTTGAATELGPSPATGSADAASCANAAQTFPSDLAITITNTPASGPSDLPNDSYLPGISRTYTIVVSNNGPFGVVGATVNNPLPAGISTGTWTCTPSGGAICGAASGSGAISNAPLSLPAGASATYTFTIAIPPGASGNLVATASVAPSSATSDATPGNNTATDSDPPQPRLTVQKTSLGGVGSFAFTGTNGVAAHGITTVTAGTPVSGAVQVLATVGAATVVTEAAPPAGYSLTAASCTGLGAGGTATPDLANRTLSLDAAATAAGATIVCTFTNTRLPTLRVQTELPDGRVVATDQFTLNIAGPGAPASVTTTGSSTNPTEAAQLSAGLVGGAYTVSQSAAGSTVPANYTSSYSCTNALAGGQAPSGSGTVFGATLAAGDELVCTFRNTAIQRADLSIVKTASPAAVASGGLVTFTLTATNNGPAAAHGAVMRDVAGSGLDCAAPSPLASCAASGGAACPAASVPVASLLGAGVVLPAFPAGGQVAIALQCRVLATGQP